MIITLLLPITYYGFYFSILVKFIIIKNIKNNNVIISSGLSAKYNLNKSNKIELNEKYSNLKYEFDIDDVYNTTGSLIVFIDQESFKNTFTDGYLVSYFSDNKLNISEDMIYKTITYDDLVLISNQLADSMGRVFVLFVGISVILFVLLVFLLAKIVIEKNQTQISMLKIIGYKTTDINKIYNVATGIVTIISLIISTFIAQFFIKIAWNIVLKNRMKGWLDFYVAPYLYALILVIGIVSFIIVYFIETIKISKINLADALKDDTL